jgi:sulfur carrier protein
MNDVTLSVNGDPLSVPAGSTVADVVARVVGADDPKGIAVALDRSVIPRSEWRSTPVVFGSRIEVVTAAAGG